MSKIGQAESPNDTEVYADGARITVGNRNTGTNEIMVSIGGKSGDKIVVSSVLMGVREARAVVKALQDQIDFCEAANDI